MIACPDILNLLYCMCECANVAVSCTAPVRLLWRCYTDCLSTDDWCLLQLTACVNVSIHGQLNLLYYCMCKCANVANECIRKHLAVYNSYVHMNVWVTGLCMLVFVYVFSSCSHQYRITDFMQLVIN